MKVTKSVNSLICLMLALVMAVTSTGLTACNKTSETSEWKAAENEWVSLGIDVAKSEGHYTVTLTHDSDVFGDKISAENIKIEGAYLNETDAPQESTEPTYTSDTITAFQVERESAKKLVITFDATADYTLMTVAVHKSVMSNKMFGDAYWREGSEVYLPPSVSIVGEFTVYDQNPTLNIVLENTTFSDNLSADMVVLDGAFRGITVTGVTGNGQNVTVTTTGTINDKTIHGKVTLKAEATLCGSSLDAFTTVKPVGAAVIPESYRLVDGNLEFRVEFGNIALTADKAVIADAITAEDLDIGVKEVGPDYAILTIATDAATVDEALDTIGNVIFSIAGSVLSTGKDAVLFISATTAELSFTVDYVSLENDKYRAEGTLYALYGDMEELTAADLTFGGDFAGANVESLKKKTSSYSLVFTFDSPYEGFDLETCELNGTLTVSEGKIKNLWGTNGNGTSSYTYVYQEMDKELGDFIDATGKFVGAFDSNLSNIGKAASAIGGVAGVANGVLTILKMTGVIQDSTDRKLKEIKEAVDMVSSKVDDLAEKLTALGNELKSSLADVSSKVDKAIYTNVSSGWNTYIKTDVGNLKKIISEYEEYFRTSIVRFLNNDPNNPAIIKIYVDSDGNVTLPGITANYSPDGKSIDTIYTYMGNKAEVSALAEEMIKGGTFGQNRHSLYNGFDHALKEGFENRNLLDLIDVRIINKKTDQNDSGAELTRTQLYYGMINCFAKAALDRIGVQKILNAYKDFCYHLGYKDVQAGMSSIDCFYTMMTLYYNFYDEAENDIKLMRAYLDAFSIKAFHLAAFAQAYDTNPTTVDDATAALGNTLKKKAPGEGVELPTPKWPYINVRRAYSFVAGRKIWVFPQATGYSLFDYIPSKNEVLSKEQVKQIQNRYKTLKKIGITEAESFFEYLCGDTLESILEESGWGETRVAIDSVESSFKPDGSLSLYAYNTEKSKYPGASYFTEGKLNKIDCSGKREEQYYSNLKRIDTTFLDDTGTFETVLTYAEGKYDERHGSWTYNEHWKFFRHYYEGSSGIYLLCY
ncbi:MAG: hypothetical protein GX924_04270 [Clostridiaceae bacterium]|nr:hypothetical protein [Clostridiaceae bacterium]